MRNRTNRTRQLPRRALGLLALVFVVGCWTTIPKQDFDAYVNAFDTARTTSQDFILQANVAAKDWAQHPANSEPPAARYEWLQEKLRDQEERLKALEVIDRYNRVLVKLAEGEDPEVVKGDLQGLGDALSALGSTKLAAAISKATPYTAMAAEIIALIDDATKRAEFKRIVLKAQAPVGDILDVLAQDGDNIHAIVEQRLAAARDPHYERLTRAGLRFQLLANQFVRTSKLDALVARSNDTRATLRHKPLPPLVHTPGARTPTEADLQLMETLLDEAASDIVAANAITAHIEAHAAATDEYKKLLGATRTAFAALNASLQTNRPAATADFLTRVLALREAFIRVQEGGRT